MTRRARLAPAWRGPTIPYMPGIRYGRPGDPRHAGTVIIRSRDRRPRRVSIAPAFDPNAISMTPIPGWTAAASSIGLAA